MEPFIPKRILWPHGPLRVLFSVFAVLSAVCLYFATPRFAESPSLFATAVLTLFVAEVTAFEVGVRRLKVSAMRNALREEADVLAEIRKNLSAPAGAIPGDRSELGKRLQNVGICLAKQFALFAELTPAEFELITSAARVKHFSRRETIFTEGDPVRHFIMVVSGVVKRTQMGISGNEVIIQLQGAGQILGSIPVRANRTQPSSAKAVQPSVALVWDAEVFEALMDRFPAFRRNMVQALEKRVSELEQRYREVSSQGVGSRLGSELVRCANLLQGTTKSRHREIPLSVPELAQLLGTTVFTVTRLLLRWQAEGIVTLERRQGREVVTLEKWLEQGFFPASQEQEIVTQQDDKFVLLQACENLHTSTLLDLEYVSGGR